MWFFQGMKRQSALPPLSVSMTAAKLGDRVLVMGCGDPMLIAAIGGKTGLTGRTLAVDPSGDRCRAAEVVALREGALIETMTSDPRSIALDGGSFDLVVLRDAASLVEPGALGAIASEARRLTRPGGRCLLIDGTPRTGLAAIFGGGTKPDAAAATSALNAAGFAAVRTLADRDGQIFVEAMNRA